MENSCRMRESLFVAREKTKNSLESQQELTEHTLRKRIFDTQRARNEFEWQIIKVKFVQCKILSTIIFDNVQFCTRRDCDDFCLNAIEPHFFYFFSPLFFQSKIFWFFFHSSARLWNTMPGPHPPPTP